MSSNCEQPNHEVEQRLLEYVQNLQNEQTVDAILSNFHTIVKLQEREIGSCMHIRTIGTVPSNLIDYTALTILDLTNMNLELLPDNINNITTLRIFNCDSNRLTHVYLNLPDLVVLSCFDNNLTEFPTINCPKLSCLHIGKNNITTIPYDAVVRMELCVFLYFDNPFDTIKTNIFLQKMECKRQQFLCSLSTDLLISQQLEFDEIMKNNQHKKLNISLLKTFEETIFETYYYDEFVDQLIYSFSSSNKYLKNEKMLLKSN